MTWRVLAIFGFVLGLFGGCDCGDGTGPGVSPDGGRDADATDGTDTTNEAPPLDTPAESDGHFCASVCGASCCEDGDECVFTTCMPACASTVRCGADLATCCEADQVCLGNGCVDPGEPCSDSFDCPEDQFCEPTLGRCLPQLTPVTCEVRPTPAAFEMAEEWHWQGVRSHPTWNKVLTTPVVGDIDADGTPDVAFSAYGDTEQGMLVVVRGDDGSEIFAITEPMLFLDCRSQLAIGNLDSDPELEIVGLADAGAGGGVVAFEHDGTLRWRLTAGSLGRDHSHGAPLIADMNGDGSPEVVLGGVVISADGTMVEDHDMLGTNWFPARAPISAAIDMDGDGSLDLVGGNRVVAFGGRVLWENPLAPDGYVAVADFFADAIPDVVSISDGRARILSGADGSVLFGPAWIPGGGTGGAPTVADFDGDGRPEFATAGQGHYAVFDPDCQVGGDATRCSSGRSDGVLWDVVVQDASSSATGSSVFDFEGDGRAEVVYNDECFLRVLDGTTGAVLLERANSSRTGVENPVVVDVDGDNHSEIIVPANDDRVERDGCVLGTTGVFAFGDPSNRWVRTRRIWNQHAYHVTNVHGDGSIPANEAHHWTEPGLNTFRQNLQGEGTFNAPDLMVVALEVSLEQCPTSVTLRARVGNAGSLGVAAGVPVAFRTGTAVMPGALLGVAHTTVSLLPGASTLVSLDAPLSGEPPYSFFATVDDDGTGHGTITECNESGNATGTADLDCTFIPQ